MTWARAVRIILGMSVALSEWELWAQVHLLRRLHGDGAVRIIADRIGEFLLAGDEASVRTWRAIEDRLGKLNRGGSLH